MIIVFIILILFIFLCIENFTDEHKYTAIIIEPRKHNALEHVMNNFTKSLNKDWQFIIFHGNLNETFVRNIVNKIDKDRIKMINLKVDNLTIHDYNTLLYDRSFYNHIPTEVFMIFQTDTIICNKDKINDFIEYDYVGAPWVSGEVGNGGLSLRRKSKMLEILDKCIDRKMYSPVQLHNEDAFFANICRDKVNINKPDYNKAKEFAVETVYHDKPFGIHKCWGYIGGKQLENIKNNCPDLDKLIISQSIL